MESRSIDTTKSIQVFIDGKWNDACIVKLTGDGTCVLSLFVVLSDGGERCITDIFGVNWDTWRYAYSVPSVSSCTTCAWNEENKGQAVQTGSLVGFQPPSVNCICPAFADDTELEDITLCLEDGYVCRGYKARGEADSKVSPFAVADLQSRFSSMLSVFVSCITGSLVDLYVASYTNPESEFTGIMPFFPLSMLVTSRLPLGVVDLYNDMSLSLKIGFCLSILNEHALVASARWDVSHNGFCVTFCRR